ncbi:hypothetical protein UlMin_045180 [Ulmus minor]
MADDFDTCVGLKRRISDIGESSDSASTIAQEVVEQSPVLVSSPKQDQDLIDEETTKILVSDFVPKKPKSVEDEKVTKESANPPVASDDCLEVKKKQLLQELEAMVMPGQELIDRSLGIQVIDETALIDSFSFPLSKFSKNKTEAEEKKAKRSRRKAKGTKIVEVHSGFSNNGERTKIVEVHSGFSNNGERTKIVYSRDATEALRFVNVVEQKKMWKDLYIGLGPAVRKEYDGLVNSKHHKNTHFNFDNKQRFGKKEDSSVMLGLVAARGRSHHMNVFVH